MGKGSERAVLAGLVGYAACQWGFLSTINHCRFFDRHRAAEVAEFQEFTGALGGEMRAACASGAIRHVLFTDADVASPYLVGRELGGPGCGVVRETVVTPFRKAELLDCGSLVIVEEHLPAGTAASEELPPGMRLERTWVSGQGHFGYKAYRAEGCPGLSSGAVQAAARLRSGAAAEGVASAPAHHREQTG